MRKLIMSLMLFFSFQVAFAGDYITYLIEGQEFEGYYASADNSKGLVIVIHDWDGLDSYEVKRADMLAKQDYNAFAIDLYGKGNRPQTVQLKKAETAKLYQDRETMRNRILAGLNRAREIHQEPAVVMGYCFGGAATLELARSNQGKDIKGYASFHGGLTTPKGQSYSKASAPIFIAHGAADKHISLDDVNTITKELEAAKTMYTVEVYSGAPHAFTVFGSPKYQERADKQSWASFIELLKEVF